MFRILIDTCVWLDLAKDYHQQAILGALEELLRQHEISLILPRPVVDEFARNKARVIEESTRSLSSTLKRVKDVVENLAIRDASTSSSVSSTMSITDFRHSAVRLRKQPVESRRCSHAPQLSRPPTR